MSDDQGVSDTAKGEDSQQPMDLDNVGDDKTLLFLEILNNHIDSHNIRPWWNALPETYQKRGESHLLSSLNNPDTFHVHFREFFYFAYMGKGEENEAACGDLYNAFVKAGLLPKSVPLTLGLDQEYCGEFDLLEFRQRIDATFQWYEKKYECDKYISPSFSVIQSRGMGKTKLMKQYKQVMNKDNPDIRVVLLLCVLGDTRPPADHKKHFDALLRVPKSARRNEYGEIIGPKSDMLKRSLHEIVWPPEKKDEKYPKTEKVVLLIDEAHLLVTEGMEEFYASLHWWLRRIQYGNLKIVAVFAGAQLSLANYQRYGPSIGFSRDPQPQYHNYDDDNPPDEMKKKLYDPFYTFTTMAMEHVRFQENTWDKHHDELYDIRTCGYFGRPLFAAMLKADKSNNDHRELELLETDVSCDMANGKGHIVNAHLYNIMARVLLSNPEGWKKSENSLASVLASRVELDIVSYEFVAKAISEGYGYLVHLRGDNDAKNCSFGTAKIAFPPDPVCAALAMGLMQDSWSLSKPGFDKTDTIVGATPQFWVQKASAVFEQQLCMPNRDDAGEVLAALYMLLCGDELRKGVDPCMRKFEINLCSWLKSLVVMAVSNKRDQPGDPPKEKDAAKTEARRPSRMTKEPTNIKTPTATDPSADVLDPASSAGLKLNFIQVVRNHFRSHSWFFQNYLKFMYDTAVACFVFGGCPAMDLVFAIRDATTKKYHPAFVSIKCWDTIGHADMENTVDTMKAYLEDYRDDSATKALCILLVIGSQHVGTPPQGEGKFPMDDAFVTVVVPEKDKFGVTDAIIKRVSSSVKAEVLESQAFAHVEDKRYALQVSTRGGDLAFGDAVLADQGAFEMESGIE